MVYYYARLNDLGGNLGTEADPFTTLGAVLAVAANGDRILIAGDGTDDPFLDQLNLVPFHTLAVVQWPGEPLAHIDFQAGAGGFGQATVMKNAGWAQGGVLELEGFHVWNNAADQDNAVCVVFQGCNQSTQKVYWDCVIRQVTAARGLMVITPSAGAIHIKGEVWDAVGAPGGGGRCLYITGQDGGTVTVDPFKVLRCNTSDHATYCSAQESGKTVLDHLYVEQFGVGEAFCQWLKVDGTLHVLRSHFSYPSIGGWGVAVLIRDSDVGTGETLFERVEIDTLRDCDPVVPWRNAFAVLNAPDVKVRNCTLIGDLGAVMAANMPFGPPGHSRRLEVTNTIMVARDLDPGASLAWIEDSSIEGTRFDGNCYYMLSPTGARTFRMDWNMSPITGEGERYTDIQTWRSRRRQDSRSYHGNPNLIGLTQGNFRLTRLSPCRDSGIICPLVTDTDADGNRATHINPSSLCGMGATAIDIGAYEFGYDAPSMGVSKRYGRPIYGLQKDSRPIVEGWFLG